MKKTLGLDSHILLVSSDFLEEYSIFVHLQTKGFCQQIEIRLEEFQMMLF